MPEAHHIVVLVRVQPRASRSEIQGVVDGRLRIKTTASPVDGKANKAVTRQLAKVFSVPPSRVILTAGQRSRNKSFRIERPTIVPDFAAEIQNQV